MEPVSSKYGNVQMTRLRYAILKPGEGQAQSTGTCQDACGAWGFTPQTIAALFLEGAFPGIEFATPKGSRRVHQHQWVENVIAGRRARVFTGPAA